MAFVRPTVFWILSKHRGERMRKSVTTILLVNFLLTGCATYERDPNKLETTPTSRFVIYQPEGTVFDTKTKLTWKICAEGKVFSGGLCVGDASAFAWNNAMQVFGDKGDGWRLPNVDELNSIVEENSRNPAINVAVFPNTPPYHFWSATVYASNPIYALAVGFDEGSTISRDKATGTSSGYSSYVRLVRGAQWFDPLKEGERKQTELAAKQKLEAEQVAIQAAAQAERDAYVTCNDKTSCDKTFSLTQIYINSMASQKIQVATDTIIETYNPTEYGNIGMGAVKIPSKGGSEIIRLSVTCKVSDSGHFEKYCESKKLDIYRGFRPFVNKMLGD
jgi:hypothetical protein